MGRRSKVAVEEPVEAVQSVDYRLKDVFAAIEKEFGKGAIMRFKSGEVEKVPTVSTGSLGLDFALGCGGLPYGRIVEIFGPESAGKTTLALQVIAEAQKKGNICAFVDAEHALDPDYAEKLGVDLGSLAISQPDNGEQALEIVDTLVRSNAVNIIVVDSVAALVPRAELEGDMGDSHMGLQARLMSQAMRKLTGNVSKANAIVIFINQTRMKIGVMFGSPVTTTGGNALKFYASVRIEIKRIGQVKQGEDNIGNRTRAKVVKNKMAPPFKEAEFDILFGKGISRAGEIMEYGVAFEVIEKSGAFFSFQGNRIAQGRQNAVAELETNPELATQIEALVVAQLKEKGLPSGKDSD